MKRILIFDLDNTLCDCSIFYKEKQRQFAEYQSTRTGHTQEFCLELLSKIDVTFTSTPEGFHRTRFPRAFAAASATIDIMMGNEVDEDAANHSWFLGDSVFSEEYKLFDGVYDMLERYKNAGYELFLLTKGDYDVQMRKVLNNRLDYIFNKDHIYIVPQKSHVELKRLIDDHGLNMSDCLVIGDSIRDEITAATYLGIRAVLVKDKTGSWSYESASVLTETGNVICINDVLDLPMWVDPLQSATTDLLQ